MKNYYKILQVDPDAGPEVITHAYRALVKQYHPDHFHGSSSKDLAEEKIQEINEAYSVLSSPETRAPYDDKLNQYLKSLPSQEAKRSRINGLQNILYWFLLVIFIYLLLRGLGKVLFMTPIGKFLALILATFLIIRSIRGLAKRR